MSLSSSLANALSGLRVASRSAQVISDNVANAMTEGFAARRVTINAVTLNGTGAGARVTGIERQVDQGLVHDARGSAADAAAATLARAGRAAIETAFGDAESPSGLSGRLAAFEARLVEAAASPGTAQHLNAAARAGAELADAFRGASGRVQALRADADRRIASDIATVNAALAEVASLNRDIRGHFAAGRDASGELDRRQAAIDQIAARIPLREVPSGAGEVMLVSTGGAILLDQRPAVLTFQRATLVGPETTLENAALATIEIEGVPVTMAGPGSLLGGGSLQAAFALRDQTGPEAQALLDTLAADLAARFATPGPDPTLAPGEAGLFTDDGASYDPADISGLAARLAFNEAANPARGGEARLLRDGLASPAPGPDRPDLLHAMLDSLSEARLPQAPGLVARPLGLAERLGEALSQVAGARLAAEASEAHAVARDTTYRDLLAAGGVNTDEEMSRLLLVEQAFAANARVIQAVDEMMVTLLGIKR